MDSYYISTTEWEMTLSQLSGHAKVLSRVVSFLHSDYTTQTMLRDGALRLNEPALEFLANEIEWVLPFNKGAHID